MKHSKIAYFILCIAFGIQVFGQDGQEVDRLYREKKYAAAAKAYRAIVSQDKSNGLAWFRLGLTLHEIGSYTEAIDAFQQCVSLRFLEPAAMFRTSRAYAKSGDRQKAFEWLEKAIENGFRQDQLILSDADLSSLREDNRFHSVTDLLSKMTKPCRNFPEYRAFDFLIGEWDVMLQGKKIASSTVDVSAEGCLLTEHYEQLDGYVGKNVNYYDPVHRHWRQTWISSTGDISEYSGSFQNGAMRLTGESYTRAGKKVQIREVYTPNSDKTVRQTSENSADEGKTWTPSYEILYVRKQDHTD